jgi:hypothetical protein
MAGVWEQVQARQAKEPKAGSGSGLQELAGAAVQECYNVVLEARVEMVAAEAAAGGGRQWRLRDAVALPTLAACEDGKQRLNIRLLQVGVL